MKKLLFILLFAITFVEVNAQFIIAGQYSSADCYTDLVPDSVIVTPNNSSRSFSLDINCDQIFDFVIETGGGGGLGGAGYSTVISPMNNNEISLGYRDTCFTTPKSYSYYLPHSMAKIFNLLDTISKSETWISNTLDLQGFYWSSGGPAPINCSYGNFNTPGSKFIGVRVFVAGDTAYGWIKIKDVGAKNFTIEEYTSNRNYTGIAEQDFNFSTQLYPNPANSNIEFVLSNPPSDIKIKLINSLGQVILEEKKNNSNKFGLDVSNYANGIYYVEIANSNGISRHKFIKD